MFNLEEKYDKYEKFPIHLYWSISKDEWIKAIEKGRKIAFISENELYILNDEGELELL